MLILVGLKQSISVSGAFSYILLSFLRSGVEMETLKGYPLSPIVISKYGETWRYTILELVSTFFVSCNAKSCLLYVERLGYNVRKIRVR